MIVIFFECGIQVGWGMHHQYNELGGSKVILILWPEKEHCELGGIYLGLYPLIF